MSEVSILGAIVIGVLAGWTAEKITRRRNDVITNLILAAGVGFGAGLAVALLGAFVVNVAGIGVAGFWISLAASAAGALVLLAISRTPGRRLH